MTRFMDRCQVDAYQCGGTGENGEGRFPVDSNHETTGSEEDRKLTPRQSHSVCVYLGTYNLLRIRGPHRARYLST